MITKECIEETRQLLDDFKIPDYSIPFDIETDNQLKRWRLGVIKDFLEGKNQTDLKFKRMNNR